MAVDRDRSLIDASGTNAAPGCIRGDHRLTCSRVAPDPAGMNRFRFPLFAALAIIVMACNSTAPSPALTDPKAIVTAGLDAAQVAHSVHLDVKVDGSAKISLPGIGAAAGTGTPVKLDGTTASVDVDFDKPALHATFAVPNLFNFAGDVIAIDGKAYVKSTLTGPLYQVSDGGPADASGVRALLTGLETAIGQPGVTLAKGADAQCGSGQCYVVTTKLTADQLGTSIGSIAGLPVDLTGATVDLTVFVEQAEPNHIAELKAVITNADGTTLTIDALATKWNEPVTITAPSPDQVKAS